MKDERVQGPDCLTVRMFGEFSMEYQGRPVLRERRASRVLHLLQILLYAGPEGISRERLLSRLYGRESCQDPSNNLRVTVYHLRRMLRESGLPGEDLVHVRGDRYVFAGGFPVEVDARIFEELSKSARAAEGKARLELLRQACALYRGYFLPSLSAEEWAAVEEAHYEHLYAWCMEELCGFLREQGAYEELLHWSSQAARRAPYEEWQVWQMEALGALGRTEEAAELYEQTASRYFRELSLLPSGRMLDCFRRMSETVRMEEQAFPKIQEKLRETEGVQGAYYCSYPGFVDSYRTAARLAVHYGQGASLLLCTVQDGRRRHPKACEGIREVSAVLEEALREVLDQGEVYTRYNKSQLLAILPYAGREKCQRRIGRIDAAFRQREKSRRIRVTYQMMTIAQERRTV